MKYLLAIVLGVLCAVLLEHGLMASLLFLLVLFAALVFIGFAIYALLSITADAVITWDTILLWIVVIVLFGLFDKIRTKLGLKNKSNNHETMKDAKLHFRCHNCQTKYTAQTDQVGAKGFCKKCKEEIIVPENLLSQEPNSTESVQNTALHPCSTCTHFQTKSEMCNEFSFNVREYPDKFIEKCNGEYYQERWRNRIFPAS